MEKVQGIGGIFFKAQDPEVLAAWYAEHLGIPVGDYGIAIFRSTPTEVEQTTVFAAFPSDSDYFPSPFMINFRVDDLDRMLAQLRAAGAQVDDSVQVEDNGRFGWVTDPEGNRVELWQPA